MRTSRGEIPLTGRWERGKPLLLIIRGAFADPDQLLSAARLIQEVGVAIADLPGINTPHFDAPSIEAFGAAFDEVVAQIEAPTAVVGLSIGGAAAMAMRNPLVRSRLLVDTPLRTGDLWPLPPLYASRTRADPDARRWVEAVFGYYPDRIEDRDYRPLVNAGDTVMVGTERLGEPRPIERLPSLVSEADQAAYRAGGASLHMLPGVGHHIAGDAMRQFGQALKVTVRELAAGAG